MEIDIKLNKDFERALEVMQDQYGEDFEKLNGFHESNLNYSDFVDGFIDKNNKKAVADTTIDGNANATTRDICSLLNERGKPEDKLFVFNKIFYELKKKYGLKTAKDWLDTEWSGGFYLHDAHTASFKSYSYKGSETIVVYYKNRKYLSSFEELYNLVDEEPELLSKEDNSYCKYTNDLFVEDFVDGKTVKTKVLRVIKKPKTNEFRFIKTANGFTQIVTDNHPVITKSGDIEAGKIKTDGSSQLTTFSNYEWTGTEDKLYAVEWLLKDLKKDESIVFGGKKDLSNEDLHADKFVYASTYKSHPQPIRNVINLTKELGYLIGLTITDGCYANTTSLTVSQKDGEIKDRIFNYCDICNIPYTLNNDCIKLGTHDFARVIEEAILPRAIGDKKTLNPNIINFNKDFIFGLISGFVDGDGTVGNSSDSFSVFGNSRTANNKIFYILKAFGLSPKTSCPNKNNWFRTIVKLRKENDLSGFNSIKLLKIKGEKSVEELIKSSNKRYSYTDDDAFVYENNAFIDNEKFVYDISTETGHFISNGILSHNCYAYDLTTLATKGEFFLKNDYNPEPAKHLDTFIDHVIEFIGYMSNRTSGAVGIPNVLVWTYYFWKKDVAEGHIMKNPDYYIRQEFQKLVYRLNQQFLRVDQSAFTNVSIFDKYYASALFGGLKYPDGTYFVDCIPEFIEHEKVFMEVVSEIRKTNMFTFPVLTMSILKRDDITQAEKDEMLKTHEWKVFKDEDFARWCSDHNTEWYDSNMFMSDNVTTLSSCCRLLNDTSKLKGFFNSVGGTSLSIGSIKVNTMNLVRIAFESEKDEKKYLAILRKRTALCCKTLDVIRHIIQRNVEKGLLPNYCEGGIDITKQYSTIGILGMYETLKEFGYVKIDEFGLASITDAGIEFAKSIFNVINDVKDSFTEDYTFNIESVPAERAAVILAQKDRILYNNKEPLYSNQWIPLSQKTSIEEKLRTASILDNLCSGGAIAHINIEKSFPSKDVAWDMLNEIALTGVIYFAFNTKIPVCKHNHAMAPGLTKCPICGEDVADFWTRIVGFYRPTSSFSAQRKIEYGSRQWWDYVDSLNELAYSK